MSSPLAISAVTAVLQYYLTQALSSLTSGVVVSAKAPDIIQAEFGALTSAQNQVNIFMHQVTHNPGWRNVGLPSLAPDGVTRIHNPPLALDLHYLLTAYGSDDWQAEALLGYSILMLNANPVLTRNDINVALNALPTPTKFPNNPLSPLLASSGLGDQIEMIKITPATLGREELAWLWTALKADYRPTFPFEVSVVLIQTNTVVSFAFPVLRRHVKAIPITPAQLLQVQLPTGKPSASPGDSVTLTGDYLTGATSVSLTNQRLGISRTAEISALSATSLSFVVPSEPPPIPAGVYGVAVVFEDTVTDLIQTTASLPIPIAPVISGSTVTQAASSTTINVTFSPAVLQGQSVTLILNGSSVPDGASVSPVPLQQGQTTPPSTNSLNFQFTPALAAGAYLARLQVDGAVSALQWSGTPAAFTGPTITV